VRINVFAKEGDGANVRVRVIHIADDVPEVRPEYLGLYAGGATLSFPMNDLRAHEERMNAIGISSTIGVKEMDFTSPAGEVYTSAEIVYKAPDHAFLMGVTRPDIFVPTGPIDPATGIGGPSYSARCLVNAQATMEFFRDVLGFEVRRDTVFEVGERSALLMPEGTRERFIQCFAPGSQTGYLVLMDHHEATIPSPAPGFGPPNRGIVMWSFLTSDFAEVKSRIAEAGLTMLQNEAERSSPGLPTGRTIIIEDPDGFPTEICET
jgi:catechol 2,3-dioxygenase-like lactoylglutathione lyase family enzyme